MSPLFSGAPRNAEADWRISFSDKVEEKTAPYVQIGRQSSENVEGGSSSDINFLGFNQDQTCLAVGTVDGFLIFDLDGFSLVHKEDCFPVMQIAMLFRTSPIALVGMGQVANSKLTVWNTQERKEICVKELETKIQAVRMNSKRIVVLLPAKIHIFDLLDLPNAESLHVIERTSAPWANPALCWLCSAPNCGYLVTPMALKDGQSQEGVVLLFDTYKLRQVGSLAAHRSQLQALCMNPTGQLLATASVKGTVVRLFALPSMELLCVFRRSASACQVFDLSFSCDSDYLCVSAATGTVHIFRNPASSWRESPVQTEEVAPVHRDALRGSSSEALPWLASDEASIADSDARDIEQEPEGNIDDEWNIVDDKPERLLELHLGVPLYSGCGGGGSASASAKRRALQALSSYSEYVGENAARYAKSLLHHLLPGQYRELVEAEWAVAWVSLMESAGNRKSEADGVLHAVVKESLQERPAHGSFSSCLRVVSRDRSGSRASAAAAGKDCEVLVVTMRGALHVYEWSTSLGGEGSRVNTHYLLQKQQQQ